MPDRIVAEAVKAETIIPSRPGASTRRQLHFWLGEKDYSFLQSLAARQGEPMAGIVRRLIRQLRSKLDKPD